MSSDSWGWLGRMRSGGARGDEDIEAAEAEEIPIKLEPSETPQRRPRPRFGTPATEPPPRRRAPRTPREFAVAARDEFEVMAARNRNTADAMREQINAAKIPAKDLETMTTVVKELEATVTELEERISGMNVVIEELPSYEGEYSDEEEDDDDFLMLEEGTEDQLDATVPVDFGRPDNKEDVTDSSAEFLLDREDIDVFLAEVESWWKLLLAANKKWKASNLYQYLATVKAEANLTWSSLIEFPTDLLENLDAYAWTPTPEQRRRVAIELLSVAAPQPRQMGGARAGHVQSTGLADVAVGIQDPEIRARFEQYLRLKGHVALLRFMSDPAERGDFSRVTKTGDLVGWENSALSQLTLSRRGWHLRDAPVEAFYGDRQVRTLFAQLVAKVSVGAVASEGLRLNRVLDDVTAETENLIITLCRAEFDSRYTKDHLVLKEYRRPPRPFGDNTRALARATGLPRARLYYSRDECSCICARTQSGKKQKWSSIVHFRGRRSLSHSTTVRVHRASQ